MKNVRLVLLFVIALTIVAAAGAFASEVFMPRYPAISPDGQTVVFSFQGDLWTVSANGGSASRLTAHEAYDSQALFSPDGKTLAFKSDRYGDPDIYLMPATGGVPTRLTYASSNETPGAFSPDGQQIYFTASRLGDYPVFPQLYSVPVAGGTPLPETNFFANEAYTADGKTFILAIGRVKANRVRYRGNYQREIYTYTKGLDPVRLTDNRGYDTHPMVDDNGRIYWVGDNNPAKTANIYTMDADGSNKRQLTDFAGDGVRSARLAGNGQRIVLERGTSLYLLETNGGKPASLEIDVAADLIENPVIIENKTGDATEMAVSSDGEEFALVINGDIVLVNKEVGARSPVVVPGPFNDRSISFRPGSADTLLFVTDRSGEDVVCLLVSDDEDESNLRLARKHRIEPLSTGKPATGPLWSLEGDRILYQQGIGDLHVMKADGSDDITLQEHWSLDDYSWSPDGQWVAYSRDDANFNTDVWIMPSVGGESVNISRHPDGDGNPVWSADGSTLAWSSSRHSPSPNAYQYNVFAVYLTREDAERTEDEWKIIEKTRDKKKLAKKEKPSGDGADSEPATELDNEEDEEAEEADKLVVIIDFEDIHLRARRISNDTGQQFPVAIDNNGDRIYYVARIDGESDLISVDRFGEDEKNITKGDSKPTDVELDAKGKTFTFVKGGKPSWVSAKGGDIESTDFTARMTTDRPAARLQVLDEGWRTIRDKFYDEDMHGLDWDMLRLKYGDWVTKVGHDRDFGDVVNFMLGEVNASHMGYYPRWSSPGDYGTDGYLGLEFDPTHTGDGLLISSVLPYGPCDKVKSTLMVGDVLTSVEGVVLTTDTNLYQQLETRANIPTWLTVERDGDEIEFSVVPTTRGTLRGLSYRLMEKQNQNITAEKSSDRIGYVHIQGMGYRNVERFEQNLFAAADGKEALIIDVRNNGGGWTTDLLLTILTQPVHAYTISRDGEIGYPQSERQPFYRWSKPIAVLCNEGSYSNAEIFSHAIKTIGRGPVIGTETGGNVISTGGFDNRYKGYIRLPFRGWYVWGDKNNPERNHKNQEGVHELTGFLPDYTVERTPADRKHDRDPQLDKAIELMIEAANGEKAKPQREDRP